MCYLPPVTSPLNAWTPGNQKSCAPKPAHRRTPPLPHIDAEVVKEDSRNAFRRQSVFCRLKNV